MSCFRQFVNSLSFFLLSYFSWVSSFILLSFFQNAQFKPAIITLSKFEEHNSYLPSWHTAMEILCSWPLCLCFAQVEFYFGLCFIDIQILHQVLCQCPKRLLKIVSKKYFTVEPLGNRTLWMNIAVMATSCTICSTRSYNEWPTFSHARHFSAQGCQ